MKQLDVEMVETGLQLIRCFQEEGRTSKEENFKVHMVDD